MILKDASVYNVQFIGPRPIFIDTLSFARYREGEPWVAYRQFCQHFLAPLALMSRRDVRLGGLLRLHIDGVPLDLASSLLPRKTRFSFSLLSHIHLHARSQARHADDAGEGIVKTIKGKRKVSKLAFRGIIDSLESAVRKLSWKPGGTEWGEYYGATNYTPAAREDKKKRVAEYLSRLSPKLVWDLGANTGSSISGSKILPRMDEKRGFCRSVARCSGRPRERSSTAVTPAPPARSRSQRWEPMNPAPPVTRMRSSLFIPSRRITILPGRDNPVFRYRSTSGEVLAVSLPHCSS